MTTAKDVSILGLGDMGSAIARVMLKNGWKTKVWNRTASKATPLIEQGATVAGSVAECIAASPVTLCCLLTPAAVQDVLRTIDNASAAGRILVDYTSGARDQIQQCANMAEGLGMSGFVRGMIATTPRYLGNNEIRVFYSGASQDVFDSALEHLGPLGRSVYLGTDVAAASLLESTVATSFFCFASGIVQSMAMIQKSGLWECQSAQKLVEEAIGPLCRTVYASFAAETAELVDNGRFIGDGDSLRLDTLQSALNSLTKTTAGLGVSPMMLLPLKELVDKRVGEGGAAEVVSALVHAIGASGDRSS
ncbi:hypothetical protein NLG97_g9232 [Lecanicillium saksenae]|uniref:Uncharacterized protein n=1 Tax=Lecanicillium saksenae TaxID=468837 RepID=A0ACC1QJ32_9HYPO|nr:hypothetical protein NLG97_g9232 [Lecanicillium saksenae]